MLLIKRTLNIRTLNKKESNSAICSYVDGLRDYHNKWSKSDRERQISWYNLYVESKIKHKWTYLWNRNRLTNRTDLLPREREWGRDDVGFGIYCCCYLVTKSCPTLGDPKDCSPPGSSVHGISQARILEWVAIPSSRGSSRPRDWMSPAWPGDSLQLNHVGSLGVWD